MINQESIRNLLKQPEWNELSKFIEDTIKSLDRCSDIPDSWSDKQKSIEVTARKRSAEKLVEILKPFIDYQELPEVEEKEIY